MRQGDKLVVTRLDRLGRDLPDIVHARAARGFVTILDPHVSTRGEMGHVILMVLGMGAQMERRFIKEPHWEGIVRAKAEGVYKGGRVRLDHSLTRRLNEEGLGYPPSPALRTARGCKFIAC